MRSLVNNSNSLIVAGCVQLNKSITKSSNNTVTIPLALSFSNANYIVLYQMECRSTSGNNDLLSTEEKTRLASEFYFYFRSTTAGTITRVNYVCFGT